MPHDGWHPHHHRHASPMRRLVLAAATFLPFGGASAQSADAGQRIADQANRFLALLDEGGVVVLQSPHASLTIAFGHALYEGLVCGGPPATASGLAFSIPRSPAPDEACTLADRLLAERLGAALLPEMLLRLPF